MNLNNGTATHSSQHVYEVTELNKKIKKLYINLTNNKLYKGIAFTKFQYYQGVELWLELLLMVLGVLEEWSLELVLKTKI